MSQHNAAWYFLDRHLGTDCAGKLAFVEAAGRSITYADLSRASAVLGGALHRAGIRREERLAMITLDTLEWPQIFFGAMKAGIVPVPINTLLATDVYRAILLDSRAAVVFISDALWPVVGPALDGNPYLRQIVVVGTAPEGTTGFDDFIAGAAPIETLDVGPDECAFWLYSSGSTGVPKGVRHVHSAMRATAETYGAEILGIQPDDVIFSAAKLFFAYGLGNGISFPMSVGATALLFPGRPTPDAVWQIIHRDRPTIFCGVPTLYAAMLADDPGAGDSDGQGDETPETADHALRLAISAGEALPAEIGARWQSRIGTPVLDGVGSTEMLHIFLSNAPGDVEYGSSGTAVPGYALRLVDETGAEVDTDEVGELLVNGASAADGYWSQRAKTRATFEGAWTRTGDKYTRRADGRYLYCGRTDDMFKVSGIWVSPFEVEQALIAHPAVLEAAVVARCDAEGLEKPAAFVVVKPGAEPPEPEALKQMVQDRIGKWKYPRWVEIVADLPKTATGKIQRFKLRQDEMG